MDETENNTINIRLEIKSNHCSIILKDGGVGMDKNELNEIFKYGYSTKDRGSGFGLHSCLNLAKSIKGELTAKSDGKGSGSAFILTLPYDKSIQGKEPASEITFT